MVPDAGFWVIGHCRGTGRRPTRPEGQMRSRYWLLLCLPAGALLLEAAAPRADSDRLLRDAYAAFSRGDLALAAALYDRAAERSTAPALVAFDLAGVQYRQALATADLRLLAEAEQNYRCCLDP